MVMIVVLISLGLVYKDYLWSSVIIINIEGSVVVHSTVSSGS